MRYSELVENDRNDVLARSSPVSGGELLFHGTSLAKAKTIIRNGFIPRGGKSKTFGKAVYFADKPIGTRHYDRGAIIVYRIRPEAKVINLNEFQRNGRGDADIVAGGKFGHPVEQEFAVFNQAAIEFVGWYNKMTNSVQKDEPIYPKDFRHRWDFDSDGEPLIESLVENDERRDVLASYTDGDGYTVSIVKLDHDETGQGRCGTMYISDGKTTVQNGYWMNYPEKEWKISAKDWQRMSLRDRATLEVKQQATAYDSLKDQFAYRLARRDGMQDDSRQLASHKWDTGQNLTPDEARILKSMMRASFHQDIDRRTTVTEAPISDMHFDGPNGDFSAGTSFSQVDRDLLSSEKGRTKIVRAFKKTPFDFEVFFINNDITNGDGSNLGQPDGLPVGIRSKYDQNKVNKDFEKENRWRNAKARPVSNPVVPSAAGKIRIVVPTNLSELSKKMPMTAWTLAHKIGHSFQDYVNGEGVLDDTKQWATKIGKSVEQVGLIFQEIASSEGLRHGDAEQTQRWVRGFAYAPQLIPRLTMKSARSKTKNLTSVLEIFPELIAQWLISGKVTMTVTNARSVELVDDLNRVIGEMLRTAVGKVLVTV